MAQTVRRGGRSVVFMLYLGIVAFGGFAGFVLSTLGITTQTAYFLGVIPFRPNPLEMTLFGIVTIGLTLGIPLALVVYVSNRYDTDAPN